MSDTLPTDQHGNVPRSGSWVRMKDDPDVYGRVSRVQNAQVFVRMWCGPGAALVSRWQKFADVYPVIP